MTQTKTELKEMLRNYKEEPIVVVAEELEWARQTVQTWKCPLNFNPLGCDGHLCPHRPKPNCYYGECNIKNCNGTTAGCYNDYFFGCCEYLKALSLVYDVQQGKVKVSDMKREWQL